MFKRLKQVLVESFVGAIALGYLLAQTIWHFANIFGSPIAHWITRKEYQGLVPRTGPVAGFSLQDALPELVRFVALLLVWFVLLRWLYFKPLEKETAVPDPGEAG
jgi:hypothetical protein